MRQKKILLIYDELLDDSLEMALGREGFSFLSIDIKNSITQLEALLNKEDNNIQFALVITKLWQPNYLLAIENILSKSNLNWLYITNIFNSIFVGPLRGSKSKGCIECFYYRWFKTKKDRVNLFKLRRYIETGSKNGLYFNNITSSTVQLITTLALELFNSLKKQSVYIINKDSLKFNLHSFVPNSCCTACNSLENDCKNTIQETFEESLSRIGQTQIGYRSLSKQELIDSLEKNYLDTQVGIFNTLLDDYESPFAVSVANLPLKIGKDEVGVGRTNNYSDSHSTAMLEGLERYCGMEPRGKKTNVIGSYNELKSEALNPNLLGLHDSTQYELKNFPFEKFDSDKKIKWVWGYSITKKQPILVPETYAYYGLNYRDGVQNSFVYEISNGCALGGNILEATLHGLFEVVERDAFLISWYTKLPLSRIYTESINDINIQLMINRFEYLTDYKISLYNMTLDTGIPCVWAIAKNSKNNGLNILSAAGSHLNKIKAIENALHELCGILIALQKKFKERKQELKKMLTDFSLVKNMEDHSLLFGLKDAEPYYDFLLKGKESINLDQVMSLPYTNNLYSDLQKVIDQFIKLDLDIIVVDQTAVELERSHLKCVKVIVPGMMPMTFGHNMRRIKQLPRLFSVPKSLGHTTFNENDLMNNIAVPHPFP